MEGGGNIDVEIGQGVPFKQRKKGCSSSAKLYIFHMNE